MPRTRTAPIDIVAAALAVATFALVAWRALTGADVSWDTLQYHWPFAARAAGLCDPQCLTLGFALEQRYHAFPMLFHAVFGVLWRIFGTPTAGHAATLAIVASLCLYLWRRFGVPLAWSWLAFLAVPLVQIHLSSSYVDLPANAALTIGILAFLRIATTREAPSATDIGVGWLALVVAAGTKLLLIPLAAVVWVAIVVAVARASRRHDGRVRRAVTIGLAALGALTILPQFAYNAWHFHNPVYPVTLRVAGVTLPGIESLQAIQQSTSVSSQWIKYPSSVRWLASVLEFDAFRGRSLPWTVDQADVARESPSFRMGGYFVVYVLGLVAILATRMRTREIRPMLAILAAATAACAFLPNSHELRYYQFWMLTLVSFVLVVAFAPTFETATAEGTRTRTHARALVLLALAGVVAMTGAHYLAYPGISVRELVGPTDATVDALPAGATLCIARQSRQGILYADPFHPGHSIHVRSLEGASAPGCDKVLDLP